MRNLSSGKFDHIIGNKKDRTTIDAFYSGRNYAPLWITDGKANERGKAAIAYLGHVDADGLDPADYPVPNFAALSDPADLAEAELKLDHDGHHLCAPCHRSAACIGRASAPTSPTTRRRRSRPTCSPPWSTPRTWRRRSTPTSRRPPGYLALKAKLAEIRAGKADARQDADRQRPGAQGRHAGRPGAAIARTARRLGDGGTTYDKALADAVKKYQQDHQLKVTGTLTPQTIDALNGRQPDKPIDIILANMERWRWMPHDLGNTYVIVNLPDFTLRVMHDGKQVWTTRIVDGKPEMPTPIMTAEMKYITINPTWNVPPSIINHEYLPALQQDPTVLERMGLKVGHNPDGTVHIWQPPGDKNALGRIRFNFPNKFLVYQHDTPDKYLFAYDKRAFSHGCMRVQDPQKYAEVLLSLVRPNDGYTRRPHQEDDRRRRRAGYPASRPSSRST